MYVLINVSLCIILTSSTLHKGGGVKSLSSIKCLGSPSSAFTDKYCINKCKLVYNLNLQHPWKRGEGRCTKSVFNKMPGATQFRLHSQIYVSINVSLCIILPSSTLQKKGGGGKKSGFNKMFGTTQFRLHWQIYVSIMIHACLIS